jgi:hypothetical protein
VLQPRDPIHQQGHALGGDSWFKSLHQNELRITLKKKYWQQF